MPDSVRREWRDISTAPKDWTSVMLFDTTFDFPVFQGYFAMKDGGDDRWHSIYHGQVCAPTDWQPLPSPPTAPTSASESLAGGNLAGSNDPEGGNR